MPKDRQPKVMSFYPVFIIIQFVGLEYCDIALNYVHYSLKTLLALNVMRIVRARVSVCVCVCVCVRDRLMMAVIS